MTRGTHGGFTLIELMIAVAIIGVLAAVAVPAYEAYARTANMAKVNTHFDGAIRYIASEFRRRRASAAMGATGPFVVPDAAEIVADLNAPGGRAPNGAPPYSDDAADSTAASGVILVTMEDDVLMVSRPAYGDLTTKTVTVDENNGVRDFVAPEPEPALEPRRPRARVGPTPSP